MIQPAIDRGAVVICDRYIDSSVAYQGYARGLGAENISYLSMWGTENLIPDLTILIDIDPSIGISRKFEQDEVNRMEQLDISFHETVRDAFLTIAEHNTDRVVVIDGSRPIEQVYADILHTVTERWNSR
jgi:dTMP kinase